MQSDQPTRPQGSNADEWHLFLCEHLDNRANSPNGLTFVAAQIADAIEARGAIWLRTIGERVQVLVERDGAWRLVIDEYHDGPISHIVEPEGIANAPLDLL